jgi:hypothetical protein
MMDWRQEGLLFPQTFRRCHQRLASSRIVMAGPETPNQFETIVIASIEFEKDGDQLFCIGTETSVTP